MSSDLRQLKALLGITDALDRIGAGVSQDRMEKFIDDFAGFITDVIYSANELAISEDKDRRNIEEFFASTGQHSFVYQGKHCAIEVCKQPTGGIRAIQVIFDGEVHASIQLTIH